MMSASSIVTAAARWVATALGFITLAALWNTPNVRGKPAFAVGAGYVVFMLACQIYLRRRPRARGVKIAHDVVDALAVGAGAALSGGLQSPFWLLLYPHVVAVSVRGGLVYGLAFGTLDALIAALLLSFTPTPEVSGFLHPAALLFCAFLGGSTGSALISARRRLADANDRLTRTDAALSETLATREMAGREQEATLTQLGQSEARYRLLLERVQEAVLILQDRRVVYANRVFAMMIEDTPAHLLSVDFLDLVPPADRESLETRYAEWASTEATTGRLESRVLTRTGSIVLVSLRVGAVSFEGKRSLIATMRDITRERQMEQEMKAQASRLAVVNEIANAVNLSLTTDDVVEVADDETRRLIAFDRLTVALIDEGRESVEVHAAGPARAQVRPLLPQDALQWALRRPITWSEGDGARPGHAEDLLAQPGVRAFAVVPLVTRDRVIGALGVARLAPLAFSAVELATLESVGRHVALALGNAQLIETVRGHGRELESLLEISRGVLERLDLGDLLTRVTRNVNRVMGTRHCVLFLRRGDRLNLVAHEGLEEAVVSALDGMRVGEGLAGWVAREGRPLAILDLGGGDPRLHGDDWVGRFGYHAYLSVPLRRGSETLGTLDVLTKQPRAFGPGDQERLTAFADQVAIALDNARLFDEARTRLEQVVDVNRQLEELGRLREEYLQNVSHEFRSPLTVIKGYAELLLEAPPEDTQLREMMRVVLESCDRLIDMVDTLIDIGRVQQEDAAATLDRRRLDFREVVQVTVDGIRPGAARKKVRLDVDLSERPLHVEGDRDLLRHMVQKVLDNAVKYSPSDSSVSVRSRQAARHVTLEIEDHGIGIASEHLPSIFDKFYTVDGGLARHSVGTGMGLYLARKVAQLHGGDIEVESRAGEGSRFTVRLPLPVQESIHYPES